MYCFFEIDDVFFWSWLLPKANCPSDQVIKFVESQPASSWNPSLAGFQTLLPRECHLHWGIAHAQKCKLKFFLSQSKVFRPQENFQDPLCYPLTLQNWLADLKFEGFKDISSHNNCTFVRCVRGINCKKKMFTFLQENLMLGRWMETFSGCSPTRCHFHPISCQAHALLRWACNTLAYLHSNCQLALRKTSHKKHPLFWA